ncbi:hypothetical protein [Polaribacter atrinae]|uniref:hypothetical protein n=1 Tax=Polaribacter atrinae TaxID=1333662 RepID=UPI002490D3B8|nr:hypothetical protein [Polaribacter atrinae]
MMLRSNFLNLIVLALFSFFFSCSSEDDNLFNENKIQTDAKKADLLGVWSIYKVEVNGVEVAVNANLEECGRDFFIYNAAGFYEEFVYQESYTCTPTQNNLNWTLNNGIIALSSNDSNDSGVMKIKNLSNDNFVFIANIDIDGDAVNEEYTFTAYRYLPPNEVDLYSATFQKKEEAPFENHIEFGWDAYKGYNTFEKYEIYRSGKACNLNGATLLKTITDVNLNTFIDEDPLPNSEACYFFKIYTDKGLLGESDPRYINTEFIFPENVYFKNAAVADNKITLSWEKYDGYYFSHYEIRVQDQNENSSPNIESVKIITDINTTSFIDENPPYINNPIYTIYAHNIFGNISNLNDDRSMIETNFIRPEILDLRDIQFLSFDAKEQSFFFYGKTENNYYRLLKYNYLTNKVTAEAFKLPTTSNDVEMRLVDSGYGKELLFQQSGDLWVYNAETLNFKYSLKPDYVSINSFNYLDNDIWILSDNDDVFTYKRNGEEFVKIDEKPHFSEHQGSWNYEITKIDKNNILLSHNNEGRAIHYSITANGEIINNGIKEIPLKFDYNSDVTVNNNLILNKKRNTMYSSVDYSQVLNYSIPKTTLNFNLSGTEIYGTNNFVSLTGQGEDYKKELIIYNIQDKTTTTLTTKGYPNFVMEDDLGNIISVSTSFPSRSSYGFSIYDSPGIFVEIIK